MLHNKYKEIAIKYRVEDLSGALIPGSRIANILKHLELGEQPISKVSEDFLAKQCLFSLLNYAQKKIDYAEFLRRAKSEQDERRVGVGVWALKEQAERVIKAEKQKLKDEQKAKEIARLRQNKCQFAVKKHIFNNVQENIAKTNQVNLRRRYSLSFFIGKRYFSKLMDILHRVDNGFRLPEKDVLWLSTEGDEYFTQKLKDGFHKNEADFFAGEFKKTKDSWNAVNASSHYRKCNLSNTADSILSTINISNIKNPKLKSALCTTHGGVKRDLMKYDEALWLGDKAHSLTPSDFRPCTLLGAVNIEIGNFELGQSWFRKAVKRGYSEESMDRELKNIFMRADKSKQDALRGHLLKMDPDRYNWAEKIKRGHTKR